MSALQHHRHLGSQAAVRILDHDYKNAEGAARKTTVTKVTPDPPQLAMEGECSVRGAVRFCTF